MPVKLIAVLVSMALAVFFSSVCAVIAALFARERKKSWSVALGASFTTMLATMTVLVAMIGVVIAAV
ncbi:hypothetical protein [Nocardiopsis sp. CA-288880]|uniref:hypothetical protein n=1 Tax=Nocardiopsis sp. CA-288880 TaxID=3239995 RepID=UPI003D952506